MGTDVIKRIRFEDTYLILLNEFEYFQHPRYSTFTQYLMDTNKIAIIFARSTDGFYQIPIHSRIEAFDLSKMQVTRSVFIKDKIKELEDAFEERVMEWYGQAGMKYVVIEKYLK